MSLPDTPATQDQKDIQPECQPEWLLSQYFKPAQKQTKLEDSPASKFSVPNQGANTLTPPPPPRRNRQLAQNSASSLNPSTSQSTVKLPQPITIVAPQCSIFDFHYFKPHASISLSDPDTWGHVPESIDTSSTFRLLFQNLNGIHPSVTEPDFMFSLHLCHKIGAGAVCLAETNLNWHHTQHHASLWRCLHRNWSASKFQTSVPDEIFLGNYQPGGTTTLVSSRQMDIQNY